MPNPNTDFVELLPNLPRELVYELGKFFKELQRGASERRYDQVELAGGKVCEVVMRILEWYASPSREFTPLNRPLLNFEKQARGYEGNTSLPDSLRFHVPQTMVAVYTIRNRRGVSHVGSEVDPNQMDGTFVLAATSWMLAELVRIQPGLSPAIALASIEALMERQVPLVWESGDVLRVLNPALSQKDQTLALLFARYPRAVSEKELNAWVEPSNPSVYRRDILRRTHRERLIEYDSEKRTVALTTKGMRYVESQLAIWATN